MSSLCKVSATILLIIEIIAGIVIAVEAESFATFLYIAIAGFLFFLFLYGIGEIVDQLQTTNENLCHMYDLIKESHKQVENNTSKEKAPINNTAVPGTMDRTNTWRCKKCGSLNNGNSISCIDCGEYK